MPVVDTGLEPVTSRVYSEMGAFVTPFAAKNNERIFLSQKYLCVPLCAIMCPQKTQKKLKVILPVIRKQ